MRKTPALLSAVAVAAVIAASLVGCSSSPSAGCTPPYSSGAASKLVEVSGPENSAATATFPTPLVTKTGDIQVSQNTAGTGSPVQRGDQVDFEYTVFSGSTGETLGSSGFGANGATEPRAAAVLSSSGVQASTSLIRSLICRTNGERYTLVTTAKDAFGAGKLTSSGIADSDTLVIVVEVHDHFLGKANGVNVLPQDGMPNVITAVNGQPGLVIQELTKPTTLRISTIKAGSGPVVKKGATVHVKYSGWVWPSTGATLGQPWDEATWTNNRAVDFEVKSTDEGGSLPVGMAKALVGAKVGSQVLVVFPPTDGFPSGSEPTGVTSGDTVMMVIDVLGLA
ncbi:MAG TPA: FKBP-type peptidyl-prolyl cis-trans isomerase [Pseudolysinimonas sp.]|nr:FKBP-type peptidyl-prolyl cis-trans isomerase [Pseudolysinimonas sp.]